MKTISNTPLTTKRNLGGGFHTALSERLNKIHLKPSSQPQVLMSEEIKQKIISLENFSLGISSEGESKLFIKTEFNNAESVRVPGEIESPLGILKSPIIQTVESINNEDISKTQTHLENSDLSNTRIVFSRDKRVLRKNSSLTLFDVCQKCYIKEKQPSSEFCYGCSKLIGNVLL